MRPSTSSIAAMTFAELLSLVRLEAGLAKGVRMKSVVVLFRLASYAYMGQSVMRYTLYPLAWLYKIYSEFLLGIELPAGTQVGPGLRIFHGVGLVVHKKVIMGRGCILRQGVTLGNKGEGELASLVPTVGDNVEFGVGAIVIGNVQIGDDSVIGAGVVVTKDVAENSVVVGQAPRILTKT